MTPGVWDPHEAPGIRVTALLPGPRPVSRFSPWGMETQPLGTCLRTARSWQLTPLAPWGFAGDRSPHVPSQSVRACLPVPWTPGQAQGLTAVQRRRGRSASPARTLRVGLPSSAPISRSSPHTKAVSRSKTTVMVFMENRKEKKKTLSTTCLYLHKVWMDM